MLINLLLLTLLLLFLNWGKHNSSYGPLRYGAFFQFFIFLILISVMNLSSLEVSAVDKLFYCSVFVSSIFIGNHNEEFANEFLLLPAVLLVQSALNLAPEHGFLGVSSLVLLITLRARSIINVIGALLFALFAYALVTKDLFIIAATTPISVIVCLYLLNNFGKKHQYLRIYNLFFLAVMLLYQGQVPQIVVLFETVTILLYLMFYEDNLQVKSFVAAAAIVGFGLQNPQVDTLFGFYFLILLMIKILVELKSTLDIAQFNSGSIALTYGQIVFVICSVVLLLGFYPFAHGWNNNHMVGLFGSITFLVFTLPIVLRDLYLKDTRKQGSVYGRESLLLLFFIQTLVLFMIGEQSSYSFNPAPLCYLGLLFLSLFLEKKNIISSKSIKALIESYSFRPSIRNMYEPGKVAKKQAQLTIGLLWDLPRFSYGISVGIVFLTLSLVIMGLLL